MRSPSLPGGPGAGTPCTPPATGSRARSRRSRTGRAAGTPPRPGPPPRPTRAAARLHEIVEPPVAEVEPAACQHAGHENAQHVLAVAAPAVVEREVPGPQAAHGVVVLLERLALDTAAVGGHDAGPEEIGHVVEAGAQPAALPVHYREVVAGSAAAGSVPGGGVHAVRRAAAGRSAAAGVGPEEQVLPPVVAVDEGPANRNALRFAVGSLTMTVAGSAARPPSVVR